MFGIFTTLYSYAWDLVMDWGLLRKGLLRERLFYPEWLYYFSIVTNLILRFLWVVPLVVRSKQLPPIMRDLNFVFFLLAFLECYRRAQWSLFRVENENINNYEKYRVIQDIPRVEKEFDDISTL